MAFNVISEKSIWRQVRERDCWENDHHENVMHMGIPLLDVSFNLPFFPTTGTLYQ